MFRTSFTIYAFLSREDSIDLAFIANAGIHRPSVLSVIYLRKNKHGQQIYVCVRRGSLLHTMLITATVTTSQLINVQFYLTYIFLHLALCPTR